MNAKNNKISFPEKKFKDIINNLDVGFYVGEINGKLLFHNKAVNRILGIDPSIDLTGSRSSQFFTNPQVQQRYLDELTKKGYIRDFVVSITKPNGKILYLLINAHMVKSNGNYDDIVEGTVIDVTDKYLLEQKLKETYEQFKLITNNSNDLISILNENFKHIFINEPAYYSILGYKKEDILGKRPRDFIHPDDLKRAIGAIKKGLIEGFISEEFRIKHKDGHFLWIESKGKYLKQNNKIIGAIFTSRNMTEKKKIEQKLKESEEKYRLIMENANDLISVLDTDLKYKYVNNSHELLGYSKEEIFNSQPIDIIHPDDVERAIEAFRKGLKNGTGLEELRVKHKDGHYSWFEVKGKTFQNAKGELNALLISRDITERKKSEEKLKEISNLKSEFLRRASHELKTPLVSIKGFSELILSIYREELNSEIISNLEEINTGCDRLQIIINSLLQTSKLESPELKTSPNMEDLSFLIKYCVSELHPLAAKRDHSINSKIHDKILTRFEKEEIHDVVLNLLMNAIKYTPPQGWIDIKTDLTNKYVIVSIKDNGIGFTEEEKNKIFKQFGKIERYGQGLDLGIDGTGLGLYISKKIIESHKGEIWMESEGKNRGSTFYFSLPLIKD
ncbi:MAG: PAS domain S-box protein [Candidatus Thorarchaeota archaeon]